MRHLNNSVYIRLINAFGIQDPLQKIKTECMRFKYICKKKKGTAKELIESFSCLQFTSYHQEQRVNEIQELRKGYACVGESHNHKCIDVLIFAFISHL